MLSSSSSISRTRSPPDQDVSVFSCRTGCISRTSIVSYRHWGFARKRGSVYPSCNLKMNQMDDFMKQFQENLIEIEIDAENLLLARHQLVENDRVRNGNREALTALRKRARTTKTSVPSPFESIMKEIEGSTSRALVKEVCSTCGNHDSMEKTWMMFPGTDLFARIPFHAAHTILDKDQEQLDVDAKVLQSYVKEKSFTISEKGALSDKISPGVLRSIVTLTDKPK